jgi:hypothetical protein
MIFNGAECENAACLFHSKSMAPGSEAIFFFVRIFVSGGGFRRFPDCLICRKSEDFAGVFLNGGGGEIIISCL